MNQEIARILYDIGEYLAMQEVPFKPRAYEKAAQTIAGLEESVKDVYAGGGVKALRQIPAVGEAIALKIEEFIKTGKVEYHEKLKKAAPVNLAELTAVGGLGPKSVRRLYDELGVKNLRDLERAAKAGKIARLKGFGPKTEENILKSLPFAKNSNTRAVAGFVEGRIASMCDRLRSLKGVEQFTIAGSLRRRKDTIGDVDFLAVSAQPEVVMDYFTTLPEVSRVLAQGETKSSVQIRGGLQVDLRVVPAESYGAALNYFTGSKDHNVALRQLAIKKGYKLNEYGLWRGAKQVAGKTEEEIYAALGLPYIEPELRENTGELEAARAGALPKLIGYRELQGDLQVQTDWSDGKASIEEMAKAAIARGLAYIVVTDHTKRLAMTNGLDEKRILKQMAEIDRVNKKLSGKIRILKGTECDILKDGSMDISDKVLARLDVVGGSVHSYFQLPRSEQTARIARAMENPHVDVIFHPTGRVLGRREPYDVDIDALISKARATDTVLEIDAYPDRSDLKDEYIRKCVQGGVKLAIDSDAHATAHFAFLEHGIAQARRGWAEQKDVVNAWPLGKMLKFLKDARPRQKGVGGKS